MDLSVRFVACADDPDDVLGCCFFCARDVPATSIVAEVVSTGPGHAWAGAVCARCATQPDAELVLALRRRIAATVRALSAVVPSEGAPLTIGITEDLFAEARTLERACTALCHGVWWQLDRFEDYLAQYIGYPAARAAIVAMVREGTP